MGVIEFIFDNICQSHEITRYLTLWCVTLGLVSTLYFGIKFFLIGAFMFKFYILDQVSSCFCSDLQEKYGKWAVISGATDGIGLGFARELVRRGMSVIIISRNSEKLVATKASLEQEPNAGEVVAIQKDFSDSSLESYEFLIQKLDMENRDIGILINNVGVYAHRPMYFNSAEAKALKAQVDVNVLSTVLLTRAVMPKMITRGRGLVLNVSSNMDYVSLPFFGIYAPSKAFITSFSKLLQFEYRKCPVEIINLTPGFLRTPGVSEVIGQNKMKLFTIVAEVGPYVRSVVNILSAKYHPRQLSGILRHSIVRKGQNFLEDLRLFGYVSEFLMFNGQQQVGQAMAPNRWFNKD